LDGGGVFARVLFTAGVFTDGGLFAGGFLLLPLPLFLWLSASELAASVWPGFA
jgi:hypothetical protein